MLTNEDFKELGNAALTRVSSIDLYYKYISLEDGLKYLLKTNTFKFTDPQKFNDPFDCNEQLVEVKIPYSVEKQIVVDAGVKYGLSRGLIREQFSKIGNNTLYKQALKRKKKDFKVSCFSESSDNVLMWSHYADRHKGLCVGFDLEVICPEYVLYPVNYISDIQSIDGMADTPYVFYYWVTFKASQWAYEKEIRAISKTGEELISYQKDVVKEVIFGCNVKSSEIAATRKELKKMRYRDIRLFKMEIEPKTLFLKKVPIKY